MNARARLSTVPMPSMPKVASEKMTTATAIPFWIFSDINAFSFIEKSIPLSANNIDMNLISI